MNKKLKLFIAFSVMLNLLLIGVGLGYGLRSPWLFGHRPPPPELDQLSPEKRELFEETMKATRKENDATRKEIRATRERMEKIMSAEVFDEAAYQAEADKIHVLFGQQKQRMTDAVKALAKQFTPEERKILAKITRRPPPGGPRGDGPPPPPPGDGPPPPPPGEEPR